LEVTPVLWPWRGAIGPLVLHLELPPPALHRVGNGGLNPVKRWWWELEMENEGPYGPAPRPENRRDLQPDLDLKYEDQTLAVYPAHLAPHPWPFPFPMDREAGIAAYADLMTPEAYRRQLADGTLVPQHVYAADQGESPVIRVEVAEAVQMSADVTRYRFRTLDGAPLPPAEAGAHIDVVVAPEFLRQYSLSGDPGDPSAYEIGVLREDGGRGGSRLMHRIFTPGRKVFISKPINHFPLVEDAAHSLLMGGGIGITPMIAMAHRLHALGRDFAVHYSVPSRAAAGYLDDLAAVPWAGRVTLHVSDEGTRADLAAILGAYRPGWHVYTCGPERYMQAVMDAAEAGGFPEEARHLEYFSVPETPDYVNHPFTLRLRDGREIAVAADQRPTDALAAAGVHVDVKCSDGLCGVCACGVRAGAVEHRDFVLSKAERETKMILCQSRAAEPDGVVEIDL
ncbi:MAG: PDR/VanB family oxidoreductase, partial [Pseudomonadota bacterium]